MSFCTFLKNRRMLQTEIFFFSFQDTKYTHMCVHKHKNMCVHKHKIPFIENARLIYILHHELILEQLQSVAKFRTIQSNKLTLLLSKIVYTQTCHISCTTMWVRPVLGLSNVPIDKYPPSIPPTSEVMHFSCYRKHMHHLHFPSLNNFIVVQHLVGKKVTGLMYALRNQVTKTPGCAVHCVNESTQD